MKTRIALFTLLLLSGMAQAQLDTMSHNSRERYYKLHLPPSYNGDPMPLIIAMHGGLGSANNLEQQSQLNAPADSAGYIVVYPEGVKFAGIRTWNAGVCCGAASKNNIDDVGFIDALIDTLRNRVAIDTQRIYATGMSNGGFMSYRLACELSHRIAAIAPVAASLTVSPCTPSRPVPVVHYHSKVDDNILHGGGVGSGLSKHHNPPLDSVFRAFRDLNKCTGAVTSNYSKEKHMTFTDYGQCSCKTELHYYLTDDGGHSWPGGKKTVIGDTVSTSLSASVHMIGFFSRHTLSCGTGSVEDVYRKEVVVQPNPSSGTVTVKGLDKLEQVSVYGSKGELVHTVVPNELREGKIDLAGLPSGIYFLRINSVYLKKVVLIP